MPYRKWPPHHRGNTVTAFATCTSLPLAAAHLGEVGDACVWGLTMHPSHTRPPTDSMSPHGGCLAPSWPSVLSALEQRAKPMPAGKACSYGFFLKRLQRK